MLLLYLLNVLSISERAAVSQVEFKTVSSHLWISYKGVAGPPFHPNKNKYFSLETKENVQILYSILEMNFK